MSSLFYIDMRTMSADMLLTLGVKSKKILLIINYD